MPPRRFQENDSHLRMRGPGLVREAGNIRLDMLAGEKEKGQDADFRGSRSDGLAYRLGQTGIAKIQKGDPDGNFGMGRLNLRGQTGHFPRGFRIPATVGQQNQGIARVQAAVLPPAQN